MKIAICVMVMAVIVSMATGTYAAGDQNIRARFSSLRKIREARSKIEARMLATTLWSQNTAFGFTGDGVNPQNMVSTAYTSPTVTLLATAVGSVYTWAVHADVGTGLVNPMTMGVNIAGTYYALSGTLPVFAIVDTYGLKSIYYFINIHLTAANALTGAVKLVVSSTLITGDNYEGGDRITDPQTINLTLTALTGTFTSMPVMISDNGVTITSLDAYIS